MVIQCVKATTYVANVLLGTEADVFRNDQEIFNTLCTILGVMAVVRILILVLSISLFGNIMQLRDSLERNRVVSVVDGDSFTTSDGRRIRLLGIDAPERGRCMHGEARNRLSEFVSGKRVRLTDVVTDDYGRILANVWVGELLVNKVMVREGLARFRGQKSQIANLMKDASVQAKTSLVGIYSPQCRNTTPQTDCVIKGNLRAGVKTYFLPHCANYHDVIVDEAYGDRWFCSEEEAKEEGFRKATKCN